MAIVHCCACVVELQTIIGYVTFLTVHCYYFHYSEHKVSQNLENCCLQETIGNINIQNLDLASLGVFVKKKTHLYPLDVLLTSKKGFKAV